MQSTKTRTDGIVVNGAELKISQFADDTQLLAADYGSLARALKWVERYAAASCGKPNDQKFEGLRMGSLKRKRPPAGFQRYKWLKSSEYATILGVPLGGAQATKDKGLLAKANRQNREESHLLRAAHERATYQYTAKRKWPTSLYTLFLGIGYKR